MRMSKAALIPATSGLTSCLLAGFKKDIKVVKSSLTRVRPLCEDPRHLKSRQIYPEYSLANGPTLEPFPPEAGPSWVRSSQYVLWRVISEKLSSF